MSGVCIQVLLCWRVNIITGDSKWFSLISMHKDHCCVFQNGCKRTAQKVLRPTSDVDKHIVLRCVLRVKTLDSLKCVLGQTNSLPMWLSGVPILRIDSRFLIELKDRCTTETKQWCDEYWNISCIHVLLFHCNHGDILLPLNKPQKHRHTYCPDFCTCSCATGKETQ